MVDKEGKDKSIGTLKKNLCFIWFVVVMCIDIKNIIIYDQADSVDDMRFNLDDNDIFKDNLKLYKSSTDETVFNEVDSIIKNTTLEQCESLYTTSDRLKSCTENLKEKKLSVKTCCIIEIYSKKVIGGILRNEAVEKASQYRAIMGVAQSIIYCGIFLTLSSTLYLNQANKEMNFRIKFIYLAKFIMCLIDLIDFIEVKTSLWLINKVSSKSFLPNWTIYATHIYCLLAQIIIVVVYFFKNYKNEVLDLQFETSNLTSLLKVIEMVLNPTIVYIVTLVVRFYFLILGFTKEVSVVFLGKNIFMLFLIVSFFLYFCLRLDKTIKFRF